MASLHKDARTGNWIIMFRWGGKQFRKSCETPSESDASETKVRVEGTVRLLKQGRIEIPKDADPGVWIISDGKLKAKPVVSTDEPAYLGSVCDAYYKDQLDKADTTLVG